MRCRNRVDGHSSHIRSLVAPLLGLSLIVTASAAHAVCCPFPGPGFFLQSTGQANLVVMDRDDEQVTMIPNITFQGDAADFALVVPTPTVPAFESVSREIWNELAIMTSTIPTRRNGSSGCGTSELVAVAGAPERDDVNVISEETVGAFQVTVISSSSATGLVQWLTDGGIPVAAGDAAIFAPFIDDDWVFTVMRIDPDAVGGAVPAEGWNHSVDPVAFTYDAAEFDLALPITSINRGDSLPMRFYVFDQQRTQLGGFDTMYANRLSRQENQALRDLYPNLVDYLSSGRTLTRLDRRFGRQDDMSQVLRLERSADQRDVIPGANFGLSLPLLVLGLLLRRRRHM